MFSFYRILSAAFGLFETVTNTVYLSRRDGISKSRRQHRELPSTVCDKRMKKKVITMLCVGIMFLVTSVTAIFTEYGVTALRLSLTLYSALCIFEAVEFRRHALAWALAVLILLLTAGAWIFL